MTLRGRSFSRRVPSAGAEIWAAGRPPLARLDIELTERCNNECIHCSVGLPAGDGEARRRESTTEEIVRVLTEAASLGCLAVRFTGGEPLLREDFEEIYVAARKLGLRVRLFTNATLVTPRLAGLFKRIPPLERMEVSVYGMTKEREEAVTGNPGSHDASRRGIRRLIDNGVPFILKGAVLPPTRNEMDAFEAWAKELTRGGGRPSYAMIFDLRTRRDDESKNERIRALRISPGEYVRLTSRWGEPHRAGIRAFVARFGGAQGDRLFTCLSDTAAIDAYGRFQVCLLLRHPATVSDLSGGSLGRAVAEFLPMVKERRTTNAAYLERCGRCFLKSLCLQCPARSWAEHGTLDTPVEYLCDIAHAEAEAAGLLREAEKAWGVADWRARVESPGAPGMAPASGRADLTTKCMGE
jgi:radical SAM protein with 4Fe4S-binding SPASM domain